MDFKHIEKKWQERWEKSNAFNIKLDENKKKFYCLEMFPYPSGSGLHMGHTFNYTIGDIYSRFKRMNNFNVLYPMGYDSFGLPAENAAIKANSHPKIFTQDSINNFIKQQKELGLSYDWKRMISTCDKEYYKWNQYLFLKLYENNLVYRKKSLVNWCNECKTVLANEQVHNGKCWRHTEIEVDKKELDQWYIKTSKYAQELLDDLEKLDWPEKIKIMQRNWIGRSEGLTIKFDIVDNEGKKIDEIETFTTRPDTVYGITYLVLSAEHPKLKKLVEGTEYEEKVMNFSKQVIKMSTIERTAEGKEKNGMFIGKYFINPFNNKKLPLWVADYVLPDYGTGAVMAVPAHDQRDYEFAKKYDLDIIEVIKGKEKFETLNKAYIDEGKLINSDKFNDLNNVDAIKQINDYAEKNKIGKKTINYKLKDWLVSRQRYWGTPIPFYYDNNEPKPIPYEHLPVLLPEDIEFGKGNPLETSKSFYYEKDGIKYEREKDTMDTFFDSSWYFLRYCDPNNDEEPFSKKDVNYFMPVDQYIGGAEHACMHLIYARFFTKALRDIGLLNFDEPFLKLFNQGMLHGEDGYVMSKSRGNVVLPETVSEKYGIDTARFFLTSLALPNKDLHWNESGIEGSLRFIKRVFEYYNNLKLSKSNEKTESKLNKTIKEVTHDIDNFKYNLALIKIRALFESFDEESKETHEMFLKLLHPFCPHITEELWEKLGNKELLTLSSWPSYDENKINEELEIIDKSCEELRKDIIKIKEYLKIDKPKEIKLIISPIWKFELFSLLKKQLEKTRDPKEIIPEIMKTDLKKYSKDIMKIIPSVLKDASKMPLIILNQKKEFDYFNEYKINLEKEFNCNVIIEKAEESKDNKANLGMPLKPAIVIL
ncbi:MAG: leucine--tRNA ligase [Candidatus Woesearchaeota archaeon]